MNLELAATRYWKLSQHFRALKTDADRDAFLMFTLAPMAGQHPLFARLLREHTKDVATA